MKEAILAGLIIACSFSTRARGEDVRLQIKDAVQVHPRLFVKRGEDDALRRKIHSDPALRKAFAHVVNVADGILDVQPVEREQVGRRLLGVSRTCLKRVFYLSFCFRMTQDDRYAVRAQEEMLAVAAFDDWNPSHFLDVAEMTAALAIGYDWLHDELDPSSREIIRKAIIEKGLRASLNGGWWVKTSNNWNQVCHGGLTLGALAVLEDEPDLAEQIIARAIANVPTAMAEYAPDGAYPEGPGYWKYGTTYNVILISALESVLGSDFELSKSQGFLESSDYYLHATGPTGLLFNYSDGGSRAGVAPAMYWFAARRKDLSLLWREHQELDRFLPRTTSFKDASDRMFPFLLIWAGALDEALAPKVNHWKADGETPVAMHRSGWGTPQEIFVGVKAGSPGANHAHMDIGSFVMDANGVRWAEDLGSQSYNSLESKGIVLWDKDQTSQRWDVFRLNNFSHNTLVVDGKKQQVHGRAPIIGFSDKGPMPHTIVDMGSIYKNQIAAATRGVGLLQERAVLVQDDIETLDHKTVVRWGMVTRASVDIRNKHTAILRQDDQHLVLSIHAPADAEWELFETAPPPQTYDAPNEGTRMIGFNVEIPPSTKARFVVVLSPGEAAGDPPEIRPMADW
ncbi:MAG: hypothetical protein ACI9OU_000922 [Candidatus Promineifilaceae bacterium]|jgi:hypothetical protein